MRQIIIYLILIFSFSVYGQDNPPVNDYDPWQYIDLTAKDIKPGTYKKEKKKIPSWVPVSGGILGVGTVTTLLLTRDEPTPNLPIANPDIFSFLCKTQATLDVLGNDTGEGIHIISVQNPAGIEMTNTSSNIIIANSGTSDFNFNYTIGDNNGNQSTAEVSVTIYDDISPVIECPPDIDLSCNDPTDTGHTGEATGTDNCTDMDLIKIEYTDNTAGLTGPDGTGYLLRTWNATDESGKLAQCMQTITVKDSDAPTIICPSDMNISCDHSYQPDVTGKPSASDNCTASEYISISWKDNPESPEGCNGTGTITRTWTGQDASENKTECNQVIIISDDVAPVINCPENITVNSADEIDPAITGYPDYSDNCTQTELITISYDDDLTDFDGIKGKVIREWTAIDACDNSGTCEQLITVISTSECNIEIEFSIIEPDCGLNNGSIKAEYDPTTMDYQFLWSTGESSSFIKDLEQGEYSLTVTDNVNNCDSVFYFTLNEQDIVYVDYYEITAPDCPNSGNIELFTNSPGNGIFNLNVDHEGEIFSIEGISGNIISLSDYYDLMGGTYFITIYDVQAGENCSQFLELYVPPDDPYQLTVLFVNPATNSEMNNGSAGFGVPVSEVTLPLKIFLNGVYYSTEWEQSFFIENLSVGEYQIFVTDANACPSSVVGFEVPFSSGLPDKGINIFTGWTIPDIEIDLINNSIFKPGNRVWKNEFPELTEGEYKIITNYRAPTTNFEFEKSTGSINGFYNGYSSRIRYIPTILLNGSGTENDRRQLNFISFGCSAIVNKNFKTVNNKIGFKAEFSMDFIKNLNSIPLIFGPDNEIKLNWTFCGLDLSGKYCYEIRKNLTLQCFAGISMRMDILEMKPNFSPSFNVKINSRIPIGK